MKNYFKSVTIIFIISLIICGIFSVDADAATKKIYFTPKDTNITMYASAKKTLKVSVVSKYQKKKIIFSSSNKKVAKVTKKGVVKALSKGRTTIYAKIKGTKKRAKSKIKVLQNVKNIIINQPDTKYYVGKTYNLSYTTVPQITDEKIKWKTSDKKIAKITQQGELKVKVPGSVTVSAYSNKTKKTSSVTINTEYVPAIKIKEGKKIFVDYGDSIQLHLEFVNHPAVKMTFSSGDDLVKITPSGYVTTTRPGTAYITATSADKKYSVTSTLYVEAKQGFVSSAMLGNLGIDDCTNLMIVAHPDDETLWGAAHLMQGDWFVVCMTSQYFPTRKQEYQKVLDTLGVKGIILDYPDLYKGIDGKWKIDSWKYIQTALSDDLNVIINYKDWEQIVTHSPTGETGHFHHKYINKSVLQICENNSAKYNNLWYFGQFYKKDAVPESLPQITPAELAFKEELLKLYKREQPSIQSYWAQMIPYENWVKATDYK